MSTKTRAILRQAGERTQGVEGCLGLPREPPAREPGVIEEVDQTTMARGVKSEFCRMPIMAASSSLVCPQ